MKSVFVGRDRELAVARELIDATKRDSGAVFCIEGSAGMGKTALAQQVVGLSRAAGLTVFREWFVDGTDLPTLLPWRLVVRKAIPMAGPESRNRMSLLTEIDSPWEDAPELAQYPPSFRKFKLFEWVEQLIREVSQTTPVAVVLEDLHNADDLSIHLLEYLTTTLEFSPVLFLLTWRPEEHGRTPRISSLKERIEYHQHSGFAIVKPFTSQELQVLLSKLSERVREIDVEQVMTLTGGVPFFVLLYLDRLGSDFISARQPKPDLAAIYWKSVSEMLSPEARESLSRLALLGNEFTPNELRTAAPSGVDAMSVLSEISEVGLITPTGADGGHQFFHDEFRRAVVDSLGDRERNRLVELIASKIEVEPVGVDFTEVDERRLRQLKELFLSGSTPGCAQRAVLYTAETVRRSAAQNAWSDAVSDLERLLARHRSNLEPEKVWELELSLCAVYGKNNTGATHTNLFVKLFNHYRGTNDIDHLVELFCGSGGLGSFHAAYEELPELMSFVAEMVQALPDANPRKTWVLLRYTDELLSKTSDLAEPLGVLDRASDLARRHGDRQAELYCEAIRAWIEVLARDAHRGLERANDLLRRYIDLLDGEMIQTLFAASIRALVILGRMNEARSQLARMIELNRLYADPLLAWFADWCNIRLAVREGRWVDVLPPEAVADDLRVSLIVPALTAAYLCGRVEEADRLLERQMEAFRSWGLQAPQYPWVLFCWVVGVRAYVLRDARWTEETRGKLVELAASNRGRIEVLADYPVPAARISRVVSWPAAESQDFYDRLCESERYFREDEEYTIAAAKALFALSWGDEELAIRHFEEAVALFDKQEEKPWRAFYLFELALLRRASDESRAGWLVQESRNEATRLGLAPLLERIDAEWGDNTAPASRLDAAGAAAGGVAAAASPTAVRRESANGMVAGITRCEREVLECLVEGLTDKEIAATLNISPYTVGNHLRNIYAKTECANRREAAHWAISTGVIRVEAADG